MSETAIEVLMAFSEGGLGEGLVSKRQYRKRTWEAGPFAMQREIKQDQRCNAKKAILKMAGIVMGNGNKES